MSNSLVKVIDSALFPASLAILSKLFGVLLILNILSVPWSIGIESGVFFSLSSTLPKEYLIESVSYSDLIMFIVMALGFSFYLLKAVFLHNTHVKPSLVIKLAGKNMLGLIQNSYQIYNKAFVWLIFLVLVNILILINTITGLTHFWIFSICTITTIVLSCVLIQDVYKEVRSIQNNPGKFKWE